MSSHRRRRHSPSSPALIERQAEDDRWAASSSNSLLYAHINDESLLQYVGLGTSSNHTIDCRLVARTDALCGPIQQQYHPNVEDELNLEQLVSGVLHHVSILVNNLTREQASNLGIENTSTTSIENYQNFVKRLLLTCREYLQLGSIWLLPRRRPKEWEYTQVEGGGGGGFLPNKRSKMEGSGGPQQRLSLNQADSILNWDKFVIRIHFLPKRFPAAFSFDWSKNVPSHLVQVKIGKEALDRCANEGDGVESKEGAIVYEDPEIGYTIINKPGSLPCHPTVYNSLENVLFMFCDGRQKRLHLANSSDVYATLPHRLDNLTHGLLIVSTKKQFASYMSNLLEDKTKFNIHQYSNAKVGGGKDESTSTGGAESDNVPLVVRSKHQNHQQQQQPVVKLSKKYKCLVCVSHGADLARLGKIVDYSATVTHYMDPRTDKVPRTFVLKRSETQMDFLPCILKITKMRSWKADREGSRAVGLNQHLWGEKKINVIQELDIHHLVELEVDLLTGRSHQIRGQLAAMGMPIVGDTLYGGGMRNPDDGEVQNLLGGCKIALHCCRLSFMKPLSKEIPGQGTKYFPSTCECYFRLEKAWWTDHMEFTIS